jgi:type VI secretion system protein ImpH
MAGQDRGTLPLVIQGLVAKPQSYSFFQAIRLLKLWTGKTSEPDAQSFYDDILRVRPHLSLSFPGSDMTEIEILPPVKEGEQTQIGLEATFLGIYGTGSPLPTFYTEELLEERSDDKSVSRDFLDILGNRTYIHFYRAWSKYRLMVKALDEEDRDYLDRLYCLLGLGHEELRTKLSRPSAALRYIGLFTQYPRSALGLKTMLADAVDASGVDVEQCVHRWVPIPADQRNCLGTTGCSLGEDCWVGSLVEDRMGKITVEFNGLKATQFHELLPGRELNYHVESLIGMYLVEPVEHDLRLKLEPGEVQPARPGQPLWSRLGYDTWILSQGYSGEAEVTFKGFDGVPA